MYLLVVITLFCELLVDQQLFPKKEVYGKPISIKDHHRAKNYSTNVSSMKVLDGPNESKSKERQGSFK